MNNTRLDTADSQNSRIFIGNVAPNTDEDLLAEHFKKHGNVIGVIVLKGYAFVQVRKQVIGHFKRNNIKTHLDVIDYTNSLG